MAGNQVQSFGYRLHAPTEFSLYGGPRSIDMRGVPQITRAVQEFIQSERSESDRNMPQLLEQQLADAIEAGCYVIQQRHAEYMAKLESPRTKSL